MSAKKYNLFQLFYRLMKCWMLNVVCIKSRTISVLISCWFLTILSFHLLFILIDINENAHNWLTCSEKQMLTFLLSTVPHVHSDLYERTNGRRRSNQTAGHSCACSSHPTRALTCIRSFTKCATRGGCTQSLDLGADYPTESPSLGTWEG